MQKLIFKQHLDTEVHFGDIAHTKAIIGNPPKNIKIRKQTYNPKSIVPVKELTDVKVVSMPYALLVIELVSELMEVTPVSNAVLIGLRELVTVDVALEIPLVISEIALHFPSNSIFINPQKVVLFELGPNKSFIIFN